ncbi:TonB family protein [Collimonas sp. PA-H2]|uniref:energy transducer TonB n=1 Tax=Collimonas sp. PA-H2 TaxID=1881062 RepID=UPI000C007825|nr:energy transducer TonB [Collimonas sp. PA-H2]PFH04386.1 TonB family protein [Collimonas sp. PA-H2]
MQFITGKSCLLLLSRPFSVSLKEIAGVCMTLVRATALAGIGAVLLSLTGCASVSTAPAYQHSNDNVWALKTRPGNKLALGQFIAKSEALDKLTVRGAPYSSPYNDSYAEYLKAALQAEVERAGKLDGASKVIISGELLENSLDVAPSSDNVARISAHIFVMREGYKAFDKVVTGEKQWEPSFSDTMAISAAGRNYVGAVQSLLTNLIADKGFQKAVMPLRYDRVALKNGAIRDYSANVSSEGCEKPEYPRRSLRNEEEGTVTVKLFIDAKGYVADAFVERSSGFIGLDSATLNAWFSCRFKPAMADGVPVASTTRMQYVWRLE